MSPSGPSEAQRDHLALERALRSGDLDAVPASIRGLPDYPNVVDPYIGTPLLALAIAWAPIDTIAELLAAGADPRFEASDGFPALLGVIMSDRPSRVELVRLLVAAGADLGRRGINGWTPLHAAANRNDAEMVGTLLDLGADPSLRTGVDDDDTALDEARRMGADEAAALLAR